MTLNPLAWLEDIVSWILVQWHALFAIPFGATISEVKAHETRQVIRNGAREIDTVINVGALKSGDLRVVERDIEAVVLPCRDCDVLSKVIIEAALLTDDEKVTACTLAKAAGAKPAAVVRSR